MSKLKRLIEAANRKCEMAWKVYSYNPEKDNELVDTSKAFDCIAAAQAHKREILEKNPNYTVEIIAESAQYKFKVGDRVLYEGDKATVVALRTTSTSPYYDVEKDKEKGKQQHPAYERELKPLQEAAQKNEGKTIDDIKTTDIAKYLKDNKKTDLKALKLKSKAFAKDLQNYFKLTSEPSVFEIDKVLDALPYFMQEAANIDVKNPGILEVPAGKNVEDLPQSHFEKLVDKKGYAEVIRALTNLEVWNKDKNKSLSSWASNMADKLKKKYRPESAQKNEDANYMLEVKQLLSKFGAKITFEKGPFINFKLNNFGAELRLDKLHQMIWIIGPMNSLAFNLKKNDIQKFYEELVAFKNLLEQLTKLIAKTKFESAQKNEDTYKVVVRDVYGSNAIIKDAKDLSQAKRLKSELTNKYKHSPVHIIKNGEVLKESAQMNETRGYTVTAELGVPDNINNRDIEDEVEKLLRASNKINVIMDVTAERK